MKKDRSNIPSADKPDRDLPKSRILRGNKQFQRLFSPHALRLREQFVDLRYITEPSEEPEYKMAFIVPRKMGKAVRRNRTRRHLKEAYRLNQYHLSEAATSMQLCFHGALMAKTTDADYRQIEKDVIALLNRAGNRMLSTSPADL